MLGGGGGGEMRKFQINRCIMHPFLILHRFLQETVSKIIVFMCGMLFVVYSLESGGRKVNENKLLTQKKNR